MGTQLLPISGLVWLGALI